MGRVIWIGILAFILVAAVVGLLLWKLAGKGRDFADALADGTRDQQD